MGALESCAGVRGIPRGPGEAKKMPSSVRTIGLQCGPLVKRTGNTVTNINVNNLSFVSVFAGSF